jgi:hypothetical protein
LVNPAITVVLLANVSLFKTNLELKNNVQKMIYKKGMEIVIKERKNNL